MHSLTIYQCFFTNSDCYAKPTLATPKGIQVHSTGANNPNLKRYVQPDDGRLGINTAKNSHNRTGVTVCANAYIGKLADGTPAVYQALPWNYRCWLSGKGVKGNANKLGYIGFEICEDNLTNKDYFMSAVMDLSVKLTAYLCKTYNIPTTAIHDHCELHALGLASNHGDIQHWLKKYNYTMDDYRIAVEQILSEGLEVEIVPFGQKPQKIIIPSVPLEQQPSSMYSALVYADNNLSVRMRAKPSTSGDILIELPVNTKVNIIEEVNSTWSKITYNDLTGYMMSEYLRKETVEQPADTKDKQLQPILDELLILLEKVKELINQALNI